MIQRTEEECPAAHLKWDLPGGKVDFDETPQQAVQREFFEETGIEVMVNDFLPHVQLNYWNYTDNSVQQTVIFAFRCKYIKETPIQQDHHVERLSWIHIKDVSQLDTLPGIKTFINLAYQHQDNV